MCNYFRTVFEIQRVLASKELVHLTDYALTVLRRGDRNENSFFFLTVTIGDIPLCHLVRLNQILRMEREIERAVTLKVR